MRKLASEKAVKLIVALTVGGLIAAFLLPVVIGAMSGADEVTQTMDVDDVVEVQSGLNVTLDSATDNTSATYNVSAAGDSQVITVNEGANETATVDGAEVTVGAENVTSTSAETTISSPKTYGWGTGAAALWVILPVILVLAVFLYFTYVALSSM